MDKKRVWIFAYRKWVVKILNRAARWTMGWEGQWLILGEMCSSFPWAINQGPIKKKNKTKTFQDLHSFPGKPLPFGSSHKFSLQRHPILFLLFIKGPWHSCQSQHPPSSPGALSFKLDGAAQPISPWSPNCPLEETKERGILFLSRRAMETLPRWAHLQSLHPGPFEAKCLQSQENNRFGFKSQLSPYPYLISRPPSASIY